MTAFAALLGKIFSKGSELELGNGVNFTGGLKGARNAATGAIDVDAAEAIATAVSESTTAGGGNVVGPDSAVDARIVLFDGTTGKLIKDSGQTLAGLVAADGTVAMAATLDMGSHAISNVLDPSSAQHVATKNYADAIKYPTVTTISASTLTLDATHLGCVLRCTNASGCAITVNTSILAVNQWFEAFATLGQVTFTQGSGVTINKPASLNRKTREAYSAARVTCTTASTTHLLSGDLEVT